MDDLKPKVLREEARRRLDAADFNPRQLILLNTGAVVLLSLAVNGLNFYLNHQIGSTGGLGGLGMRSMLQTLQTLLSYCATLVTPFWAAGLVFCFVNLVRGEAVTPGHMLEGFRRFPKLLSFSLLEVVVASLLLMPVLYLATAIYMFTPLSAPFTNALQGLLDSGSLVTAGGMLDPSAIPSDVMLMGVAPVMLILLAVGIPVYLFFSYSLHMGPYLIVTGQVRGGFAAFLTSFRMMRGNRRHLLKLDLSYWWFYLLEGVAACVLYLDMILTLLGQELPLNSNVMYFVLLAVYGLLELGLHYWKKAERDTAFVLAYEQIADSAAESAPAPLN